MSVWAVNGTEFQAITAQDVQFTFVSFGIDTCSFRVVGYMEDEDPFVEGTTLTITKDSEQVFVGRVLNTARTLSGDTESLTVNLAGPWWYLENKVLRQEWLEWSGGAMVYIERPRAILNQNKYGFRLNSREQIIEALNFCITAASHADTPFVPFQIGTIEPTANIPWEEVQAMLCSEVIQKMIRWTPDCVGWFDYSSTPPTFHVKSRINLTPISIGVADVNAEVNGIEITPRYDLIRPAVIIHYRVPQQDSDLIVVTVDKWPLTATGWEFGALDVPVDLAGSEWSVTDASVRVQRATYTDYLGFDPLPWWKARRTEYADTTMVVEFVAGSGKADVGTYTKELLGGEIPTWSNYGSGDEVFRAQLRVWQYKTAAAASAKGSDFTNYAIKDVSWKCRACDVPTRGDNAETVDLSTIENFELAEPIPVGLAEIAYNALKDLHYEGTLPLKEEEPLSTYRIGRVLNITNGRIEWGSMNALIQQVSVIVDTGETQITFGPPTHLGIPDMVELLRRVRGHSITFASERTLGRSGKGGTSLSANTADGSGAGKTTKYHKITIEEAAS